MMKDIDTIILTKRELQIMKVVWERGTATVKDVFEAISKKEATAYTTILTLMGILEEKGVLAHSRSGRAYLYRPLISRRQATRNQVRDILHRFFDGNPEKLIETVLEEELEKPELIEPVRGILSSRRQNQVA